MRQSSANVQSYLVDNYNIASSFAAGDKIDLRLIFTVGSGAVAVPQHEWGTGDVLSVRLARSGPPNQSSHYGLWPYEGLMAISQQMRYRRSRPRASARPLTLCAPASSSHTGIRR